MVVTLSISSGATRHFTRITGTARCLPRRRCSCRLVQLLIKAAYQAVRNRDVVVQVGLPFALGRQLEHDPFARVLQVPVDVVLVPAPASEDEAAAPRIGAAQQ